MNSFQTITNRIISSLLGFMICIVCSAQMDVSAITILNSDDFTIENTNEAFSDSRLVEDILEPIGKESGATVITDKPKYAPSETAYITAKGFKVGETVEFLVLHIDGKPNTGNGHTAWQVTDGGKNDLDRTADGNIKTDWFVDPDDSFNSVFELTAHGLESSLKASWVFKDDTPVPTGLSSTFNPSTGTLTLVVNWGWTDETAKTPSVAVFADIDGDGDLPTFEDTPASWTDGNLGGNDSNGNGGLVDEFLGQTNLPGAMVSASTSVACSGITDQTVGGFSNSNAGINDNIPHVLLPYGITPINNSSPCDLDPGLLAQGTFTLTFTGLTQAPLSLCLVVYDIHIDNSGDIKDTSGNHSPLSAGNNRNTDNSVEEGNNDFGIVSCTDPAAQPLNCQISEETAVKCLNGDDGSFVLTINNGIAPYNYTISGGPTAVPNGTIATDGGSVSLSGLKAGAYFVTVGDSSFPTNLTSTCTANVDNAPINLIPIQKQQN